MTPEGKIVKQILDFVNKNRYGKAIKIHGSQFMERGTPDILGGMRVMLVQGGYTYIHFLVEVKQPGEVPTKLQFHRMGEWSEAGYHVDWVDSLDGFKEFALVESKLSFEIYPTEWLEEHKRAYNPYGDHKN